MNPWMHILVGIISFPIAMFIGMNCRVFLDKHPTINLFLYWTAPTTLVVGIIRLFI